MEGMVLSSAQSCRSVLNEADIVRDLRSDRKSAEQPRHCPFHENYQCDFVGTRQEVAAHKAECQCDPDLCTSKRCENEKAAWSQEKSELQRDNRRLRNVLADADETAVAAARVAKRSLVAAALQSP